MVGSHLLAPQVKLDLGHGLSERTRALLLPLAFKMILWIFISSREPIRDSLQLNLSRLHTTSTQLSILTQQLMV